MAKLFVGNFDFEHELAAESAGESSPQSSPPAARRIASTLASVWLPLAAPTDLILSEEETSSVDFTDLREWGLSLPQFVVRLADVASGPQVELVPWGWSGRMHELAADRGWLAAAPSPRIVAQVNSRGFRLALEQAWQIGLEEAARIRSLDELAAILARQGDSPGGWVLKAQFGMTARERILGRGTAISPQVAGWAARRLKVGEIVFEPWLERIAEASIQVTIPESAPPVLEGLTPLLCDAAGVYRGNRCTVAAAETAHWQGAIDVALRLAAELQSSGYFGPLGIDAMWYRDRTGTPRLRPLQDLNARYTMGRLALGFRRLLAPDEHASWLQFPLAADRGAALEQFRRSLPRGCRMIWTSPRRPAGPPPSRGAALLIAPSADILDALYSAFFQAIRPEHA